MKKKDYIKPTMRSVNLHHTHQILAASYSNVLSGNDSEDYDNPDYVGIEGSIWDAN